MFSDFCLHKIIMLIYISFLEQKKENVHELKTKDKIVLWEEEKFGRVNPYDATVYRD